MLPTCQGITKKDNQCKNLAVFPVTDPRRCFVHASQEEREVPGRMYVVRASSMPDHFVLGFHVTWHMEILWNRYKAYYGTEGLAIMHFDNVSKEDEIRAHERFKGCRRNGDLYHIGVLSDLLQYLESSHGRYQLFVHTG